MEHLRDVNEINIRLARIDRERTDAVIEIQTNVDLYN